MKVFVLLCSIFISSIAVSQPLWMRYTSISPDGNYILFSYQADLYKVKADGGTAIPLTQFEGRDYMPVWSPNGEKIAYASDRYGNNDGRFLENKQLEPDVKVSLTPEKALGGEDEQIETAVELLLDQ